MTGLRVVLVQRAAGGWRVGIGAVTAQGDQLEAATFRTLPAAKRAAKALAERSGLLIVHSDLPRALRGESEDLDHEERNDR